MFGMKMPKSAMVDKSIGKPKVPKTGPDDNASMKMNENMTAPMLPQRDGPARDKVDGGMPQKPKTSAKAKVDKKTMKSMRASIGSMGSF